MRKLLFLVIIISLSSLTQAQTTVKISGSVKEEQNQLAIDGATVSLLMARDSSLVKVAVTDKKGNFEFEKIGEGNYLISAGSIGHSLVYSKSSVVMRAQNNLRF